MKLKEKAREDMVKVMYEIDELSPMLSTNKRHRMIVSKMREKGWDVTIETLHDTARSLGLTVIGSFIYGEEV